MYTHIVLFSLKDKKDAGKVAQVLESMRGQIDELKDLEVGLNDVQAQRNYDVALITRFEDQSAMDRYQVSDYHQNKVLAVIKPLIANSVAADFPEYADQDNGVF